MRIIHNISLGDFTTFKINHIADQIVIFNDNEELLYYCKSSHHPNIPFLIIGGGSNILFTGDFRGKLLKPDSKNIHVIDEDSHFAWIRGDAGAVWDDVVNFSIQRGYQGLENLSFIPGSLGAAPIQNIGAYGVELSDFFVTLESVNLFTGEIKTYNRKECELGYRTSIFKRKKNSPEIIFSVTLRLNKIPKFNLSYAELHKWAQTISPKKLSCSLLRKKIIEIRRNKLPDPAETGNAGSFFKNPEVDKIHFTGLKTEFPDIPGYISASGTVKIPAGWLIEKCGWKGYRRGNSGVYHKQALILVNFGNATGSEIFNLAMEIRESVANKFGIMLEPEVNII